MSLLDAVKQNSIALTEQELERNTDFNQRDEKGNTALMLSLSLKNPELVCLLIEHSDVNAVNHTGGTPLLFAVFYKDYAMAELLINKGADVNVCGALDKGMALMTPLGLACNEAQFSKKYEIVRLLIDSGADTGLEDAEGRIPLHFCGADAELIELFLQKGDINRKNMRNGMNLILMTAEYPFSTIEQFEMLLSRGADINSADISGETVFFKVVKSRKNKTGETFVLPRFLIDKGADANSIDVDGYTILHRALKENWPQQALDFLSSLPLDKGKTDKQGVSLFMLLAEQGRLGLLKRLFRSREQLQAKDRQGNNALHYAVRNSFCSREMLEFLLKNGSEIDGLNQKQETPLMAGVSAGTLNLKLIQYFIENNADLNLKNSEGNTLLHLAVKQNDTELAVILLQCGADLNAENAAGYSAYRISLSMLGEAEQADRDEDGYYELKIDGCRRMVQLFQSYGAGREFEIR